MPVIHGHILHRTRLDTSTDPSQLLPCSEAADDQHVRVCALCYLLVLPASLNLARHPR